MQHANSNPNPNPTSPQGPNPSNHPHPNYPPTTSGTLFSVYEVCAASYQDECEANSACTWWVGQAVGVVTQLNF